MPFSMLCLLLFLATATPLSLADQDLNTCECAHATASDRIVGGKEVSPKYSLPYQVWLNVGCGGTIINRRYVLTAAHCLYGKIRDQDGHTHFYRKQKSEFRVVAGEHNRCDSPWPFPGWWPNEGGQVFNVERIIQHPNFSIFSVVNDIAILKLNTDIKFGDHVKPACLPTNKPGSYDGMTAIASGWGSTIMWDYEKKEEKPKVDYPCKLQRTSLTILDRGDEDCASETDHDDTTKMCTFKKDTDACTGDSGGPLVVVQDRKYVLVGVTSYGRGCAKYPGVYARVTHYLDWIADETEDGNCQGH